MNSVQPLPLGESGGGKVKAMVRGGVSPGLQRSEGWGNPAAMPPGSLDRDGGNAPPERTNNHQYTRGGSPKGKGPQGKMQTCKHDSIKP
ncbi:hypothetical protein C7B61_00250 [filamentous cyanobacterium CCP1]|nr:hypothetical protein C7B61_00250 [filamentous cyanobacterium CCP1]